MKTKKKKIVEQKKKNRNSQKSVKSLRLMGVGVYGGKDFWKRYVFSLEWKSEGVMDDDSGDSEEDEGEEDWLRQGWRSEAASLFQRWGEACRKERFVIFNEELAGGRERIRHKQVKQHSCKGYTIMEVLCKQNFIKHVKSNWQQMHYLLHP